MARCKRRMEMANTVIPPSGELAHAIRADVVEATIRVVNAAGAGVAWTLALADNREVVLHLAAGESYTDERLALTATVELAIEAAAGSVVEVVEWVG